MDEIQNLINSDDEWLSTKGLLLKQITDSYASGLITNEEYKELLEDIKNSDDLNEEATSLENKTLVLNIVSGLSTVI